MKTVPQLNVHCCAESVKHFGMPMVQLRKKLNWGGYGIIVLYFDLSIYENKLEFCGVKLHVQ